MKSITKEHGVSLIELMIAVALGLFLTSGILYLYLGSKTTQTTQGSVSNVQESLRFGFEYLAFDIRMAGYMGCANTRDMTPQIIANGSVPLIGFGKSIMGFEDGVGWTNPTATSTTPITRVAGTDVISLSRASLTSVNITVPSNGTSLTIAAKPAGWANGQLMIITDCERSDVFRGDFTGTTPATVAHSTNNIFPTGCSGKLVSECPANPHNAGNYKSDAQLASLESWDYFIGINAAGNPALYRASRITNLPEELVEGIDDLQIEYGLDTVNNAVFVADSYTTTGTTADWGQVVSARVTLRARSNEDGAVPAAAVYSYNGANVSDRRYRQSYTTVVGFRNLVQ